MRLRPKIMMGGYDQKSCALIEDGPKECKPKATKCCGSIGCLGRRNLHQLQKGPAGRDRTLRK